MDPMSHAALGASWAQSGTARNSGKIVAAGAVGAVSAMAPDLDALIQSPTDPLLFLEYHRQFTHALVFVPLGALLCAGLFYRSVRTHLTFAQTYGCCLLGYGTHPLLDACTTYGTQLLWPFSDARIAWSIIAVVDPLFTVPIVALVLLGALKRRARYAQIAAVWALVYLGFGAFQQARAVAIAAQLAETRGHVPVRLTAKPAFSSMVLWKTLYEHDGRYYVDAARTGFSGISYTGESTEKLDLARHFPWLTRDSQQALDVERFRRVSDDFLTIDDDAPNRIVDLRYSLVPNEIEGFWAIVLDPTAARDAHVEFITTRERAPEQALRLLEMLF